MEISKKIKIKAKNFFERVCYKFDVIPIEKNVNNTQYKKNCLLSYVNYPFKIEDVPNVHQHVWQVKEIARQLSVYGYNVDAAQFNSTKLLLTKKYDLIIDIVPTKFPEIKRHMNKGCKTIAYFTTSNPSFQNSAEKARINALEKRRGVEVEAQRQDRPYTREIENYDAYFMIGNSYNWKTYTDEFDLKEPFYIKNTGHKQEYRFDKSKKKKTNFIYFGSRGQVHKGLDLLLEVFSEDGFPCDLYVCGNFKSEKDFEEVYYKELYETSNIHPVGFVSIESEQFKELTESCVYSIIPSSSEANCGAVLTTMSAGLIPICSYECGFEEDEVIHLKDCSIETIRATVLEYAQKDDEWVKSKSKNSYDIIQERYSKKNFVESLSAALYGVLNKEN